jgi:molybdate transport system regulatory protein
MKTSARNAFRCKVDEVRQGSVDVEIILRLTDAVTLSATVTTESATDLGIVAGADVTALIKAPFVLLAVGEETPKVTTRNRIPGSVARREDGTVNTEISLDIGDGKSLIAVITKDSADQLNLIPGAKAWALFKASHVILAID